jgi:hypothetical protein
MPDKNVLVVQISEGYRGSKYIEVQDSFETVEEAEKYIAANTCGSNDEAEAYALAQITHRAQQSSGNVEVEVY